MRLLDIAAVAAFALSQNQLAAAAPSCSTKPKSKVSVVNLANLNAKADINGLTFSAALVHNDNFQRDSFSMLRAIVKTSRKYNATVPEHIRTALQAPSRMKKLNAAKYGNDSVPANATGSVTAYPTDEDIEYVTEIQIGTPPQTVPVDLDTGSSDLWVISSETPMNQTNGQKIYDISQSSTAKRADDLAWDIRYADGSFARGDVYMDVVSIGGVTAENQAVEVAATISSAFKTDTSISGLLGLAFDKINTVFTKNHGDQPRPQKTFMSNVLNTLALPVFTANLNRKANGTYNFGYIDQNEFEGDLSFVEANTTQGFWGFEVDGYSLGNGAMVELKHQAIADTGSTLLVMDPQIAEDYFKQIPGYNNTASPGNWFIPCDSAMPDLTLHIGSYKAVIPGDLMKYATADGSDPGYPPLLPNYCWGSITSNRGYGDMAIYGDIFFKATFTVFNAGEPPQLGFAPKKKAAAA